MGKRSNFERNERDFYPTPPEAVEPLFAHLAPGTRFIEPCAGDGALIRALEARGHHCEAAFDLEPQAAGIVRRSAFEVREPGALYITNPPWDRKTLHPLIRHFTEHGEAWLLFDADWLHNVKSAEFESRLRGVVSVGRVKWIPGSKSTGVDNAAWYHFGPPVLGELPRFHLRRKASNPAQTALVMEGLA